MDREQQDGQRERSLWPPTREHVLWTVGIVALLTGAILIGYRYDITLWDWIKLLIVPAVIAGGGFWFNRQQRERELEIAREQREREVEVAEQRAQDEALQAYLDQIGSLLLDKDRPLRQSKEGDEVRTLARARTLTVLSRLDPSRKTAVMQFLVEAKLVQVVDAPEREPIIRLGGADLRGADLIEANLYCANLRHANLNEAILYFANLSGANLRHANLSYAKVGANLSRADMRYANLTGADLRGADLSWADLGANLSYAELSEANLSKADLSYADLSWARGWTEEQLRTTRTLGGATMPDGQTLRGVAMPHSHRPTFEDWLKDKKAHEEDAENE